MGRVDLASGRDRTCGRWRRAPSPLSLLAASGPGARQPPEPLLGQCIARIERQRALLPGAGLGRWAGMKGRGGEVEGERELAVARARERALVLLPGGRVTLERVEAVPPPPVLPGEGPATEDSAGPGDERRRKIGRALRG